ncbi:hypothetical protein J2J97_32170 (plasmid) [Rhizobium bangladeshense]|uniref:hypothetical protein n=1 Tax=Rhizobium bangladeshense TaxID=1138189 RepID=UPI001A997EB3|nr:hypothetical protein [Rhizobium bangladeshense]QSY98562.1 hypothetical protein J2J97_32170 [Rhizobium bangladeshense]
MSKTVSLQVRQTKISKPAPRPSFLSKLKPVAMTEDEVAHDAAVKRWIENTSRRNAR